MTSVLFSTIVDSFHFRAVWILSTRRLSVVGFGLRWSPLVLLSLEACPAREDMTAICSYDINEVSWRQVRETLVELGHHDQEVD